MSTETGDRLWSVKVTTIDGVTTEHLYSLPISNEEVSQLVVEINRRILGMGSSIEMFQLLHPVVIYFRRHVVRVEFDARGIKELEDAVERANREMGFGVPGKADDTEA